MITSKPFPLLVHTMNKLVTEHQAHSWSAIAQRSVAIKDKVPLSAGWTGSLNVHRT